MNRTAIHGASALAILWVAAAAAGAERPYPLTEERAACASFQPLRRPLFGDTHVHTTYSFDASSQDTRNTPRDAYRFAKGQQVGLQPYAADGKPLRNARLRRPLDFAVVTDHAALLGETRICSNPDVPGYDSDLCWSARTLGPLSLVILGTRNLILRDRFNFCGKDGSRCLAEAEHVWKDIQSAAEEAYDRSAACGFTSFVGYEWTASTGNAINLHRNVIFRNQKVPARPASWIETPSAFDLWQHLKRDCVDGIKGCDALTIPHNSNLSGPGLMFQTARLTGVDDADQAVTRREAQLRQRWEPLVEIMQHKGDSECLPGLDTTDEACGFEKLPYDSFAGVNRLRQGLGGPDLKAERRGMVREALKKGLALEAKLGVNPLKYGILASTDSHLGTPGLVAEDDARGHGGAGTRSVSGLPDDPEFNPGGLAVLWAEENTRDSLFAAMQRREAYGTSGTRPLVRFFGGWDFTLEMCDSPEFAELGYAGGVPMGGDLPPQPEGAGVPTFALRALRDPGSAGHPGTPLQRIQIVKGWLEGDRLRERVFDAAGRDNGASVDTATCEPQGQGADELCSVWRDPDFEADQRAFYYARVLENPVCRWSQKLCVDAGVKCDEPASVTRGYEACCKPTHRATIQERAWTSPIWYSPR